MLSYTCTYLLGCSPDNMTSMDMRTSSTWEGGLFNFVDGDRFIKLGTNPAFPTSRFSVWMVLQEMVDVGAVFDTSSADMAALDGHNA